MRNGYKVYDSDTHVGPSADTLEKYLSSRVRELLPDLESRKAPQRRHSAGVPYDSPYPTRFRLGSGVVGGWGADVPRTLGEAKPRATTSGASGRFMGSKAPNLFSDDWDVDGRYVEYTTPFLGMHQVLRPDGLYRSQTRFGMYRWHVVDPIHFEQRLRVTLQGLGWRGDGRYLPLQCDMASVAYWYQELPTATFPELPDRDYLEVI